MRVENMKITNSLVPFAILISAAFFMVSCTEDTTEQDSLDDEQRYFDIYVAANYPDAGPQASGLYYVENNEGTGVMPDDSTWVLINHVAYKIPDEQVYNTYIESVASDNRILDTLALYGPYKTRNGTINDGFSEGLSMMRVGGGATFLFTSELGYGSTNTDVGAYQSLKYEVELLEVLGDDIDAYNESEIASYLDTVAVYDTVYDVETEQAIYYIIDKATNGPLVGADSTLEVAYKGYIMDGRVFDEQDEESPIIFQISTTEWAARWDLVLPRLREGEKARLIFPYQLAYGPQGEFTSQKNVKIPPYETLLFDIEIISVEAETEDDETEVDE